MSNPFFNEELVDEIREHDKEKEVLNNKKKSFNKINTVNDSYSSYNYGNEELLKTYVGDKYVNFMTKKFNLWAFLFGPIYMLYRKMYLYGFLLTLFLSIVSNYFLQVSSSNNMMVLLLVLLAFIIVYLIIGMTFNSLYIGFCVNNINRLKHDYPTLDTNELCKKEGGANIFLAIVDFMAINIAVSMIMKFF